MMTSSQPVNNVAVEVNELTKKFGDFTAVDHVSFEVPQGRIFGFLGPNGAGKTTTIRMLLGLTRPTAGSSVTLGYRIPEEAGELRPHIGYMSQQSAGVDPISRRQFWDLLYELAEEGTTIMVTTHYMDEAEHCQDLIFMQAGRLVAMGTPEAIKEKKMDGQVLEIAVDQPDRAVILLDEAERFRDVSIYGNLIHVVTPNPEEDRDRIRVILKEDGFADGGRCCD